MSHNNSYHGAPYQGSKPVRFTEDNIPDEYKPISMWGYFGYEILFSLPVIGFIILVVMCFAPANKNVKNFARSYFCFFIVIAIITIVVMFIALGSAGLAGFSQYLQEY